MLIVGDPSRAFTLAAIPNQGVGLARTEFIVTNHIGIHPMALARYPQLMDAKAVIDIAARIGREDAREFFVRYQEHQEGERRPVPLRGCECLLPDLGRDVRVDDPAERLEALPGALIARS